MEVGWAEVGEEVMAEQKPIGYDPTTGKAVLGFDPNSGRPVYVDDAPKPAATAPAPHVPFSLNDPMADAGLGAGKEATKHALNLARFVNDLSGGKLGHLVPESVRQSIASLRPHLEPATPAQKIGQVAENVAELVVPMGATAKAGSAASTAAKAVLGKLPGAGLPAPLTSLAGATARAGVDAAVTGATAALQGRDVSDAALLGGTASLATQAVMKAAPILANRIETALVKPSGRDVVDGFKPSHIFKHKLGGSLGQTYDKGKKKLEGLGTQLERVLGQNREPDFDLFDVLHKTAAELDDDAVKNFGSNKEIKKAVDDFLGEISEVAPSGKVNLLNANKVKQAVGEFGAWLHDPSGKVIGDAQRAKEILANAYYDNLKKGIEQSATNTGMVKLINQQMGEIIPIVNAVIRRIPIDQRSNVMNLGDFAGIGSGHIGLSIANRALRSGQAANALSKASPKASPYVAQVAGTAAPKKKE